MPTLATARIALRPLAAGDGDDLHGMDSDERAMRTIGSGLPGRSCEQSAQARERRIAFAAHREGSR
mgnify:CR=1 FL=1